MERTDEQVTERPCDKVLSDPSRGKLIVDFGQVVRRPLRFLKILSPFLASHHPLCSQFEGHTIYLRGRKFCVGCLFNSLSFFIGFPSLLLLWSMFPLLLTNRILFWSGAIGVAISLLSSALGFNENMRIKVLSKLLLGSGFAAVCLSILVSGNDILFMLDVKIIIILILYFPVMAIMNAKRMLEIEKECTACDFKMRWSKCPGFRDIVCDAVDGGFIRPKDKPSN
ncbi:MAG: hypothetical protein ACFFF4_01765 [Candidatus Thorarchaeota archaeon]